MEKDKRINAYKYLYLSKYKMKKDVNNINCWSKL